VGAVCHGSAGISNVKLSNGEYLISGKDVTGFSNAEEEQMGQKNHMPFLLEDQLMVNGGKYTKSKGNWENHVVVDGTLVTGQNPASATETAQEMLNLLTRCRK